MSLLSNSVTGHPDAIGTGSEKIKPLDGRIRLNGDCNSFPFTHYAYQSPTQWKFVAVPI
ncbi:MAG: hypothetical protein BWY76_01839 [bacterium ADurb.Bin429]|nr:MAG: hypothetical protein BWY76_01839 [bacterium ADurb.Bin429]